LTSHYAIIVAGGSGSRMKSAVPKQFLLLNGKPILQHTIEQFLAFSNTLTLILVLPQRDMATWANLCDQHNFYPGIQTVIGGVTRFQSVKNGLRSIKIADNQASTTFVAVHDGVRPFVSTEIIQASFETAAQTGSAVACVPAKDSVRLLDETGQNQAINRARVRLIQTPQTFRLDWFRTAFAVDEQPHFTDCASVLEHAGFPITLIEGSYENIKITTPEDLRGL
jgi:2-C-methyl-D-erythritol 4-phosphate cytidylyltransferase